MNVKYNLIMLSLIFLNIICSAFQLYQPPFTMILPQISFILEVYFCLKFSKKNTKQWAYVILISVVLQQIVVSLFWLGNFSPSQLLTFGILKNAFNVTVFVLTLAMIGVVAFWEKIKGPVDEDEDEEIADGEGLTQVADKDSEYGKHAKMLDQEYATAPSGDFQ